jgi:hypothetical protein
MIPALAPMAFRVFGEMVRVALVVMAFMLGALGFAFARVFAVTLGIPLLPPLALAAIAVWWIVFATHREHRRLVEHGRRFGSPSI